MIKTKYKLNFEVIKPLIKNSCVDCRFERVGYCRLFGSMIAKESAELCSNIMAKKPLDRIHSNIKTNRKTCEVFCFYYDMGYCGLFNIVLNSRERCQQCIDLFKGGYI